ncbi:MAG: type II toxin-antitoxin system RelE/ParE family toxin [Chitinophagales bacterium]|nr:type II toxin-antitoxin system RelE/ParE family toxin [Chitinophagales bacterium]
MYKLEIEEQAREDLKDAMFWYEEQLENLGVQLLQEVRKSIQFIVENPKHFRKIAKEYRQTKINIFPYVIVYELINNKIVIFRIFHTSRNPKHKFVKK